MRIVVVDDEAAAVSRLTSILREAPALSPRDELVSFQKSRDALAYMRDNAAEVAFLDVEMPGMTGLELAQSLLAQKRPPELIFVTAYVDFSLDAWKLDAIDYILKPFDPEQVFHALDRAIRFRHSPAAPAARPFFRCFPDFEVFVNERPLPFRSKKAKELLALLVHYQGGWVFTEKLTFSLLESSNEESARSYIRLIVSRLRKELEQAGLGGILETDYGKVRVNTDKFECDYYDYLAGDRALFKGSYMGEYVWAEVEAAYMNSVAGNDV